jgi:hypothetical protein
MKTKMELQKNHQYKQLKGPTIRPSKNLKKTRQQNKNTNTKNKNNYCRWKETSKWTWKQCKWEKTRKPKKNLNDEKLETQILRK